MATEDLDNLPSLPASPAAANQTRLRASAPPWPFPENQAPLSQTLQYKPLDNNLEEFRVLILHPKRTEAVDEPIHCSLTHTTFAQRPIYEALSYAWGDHAVVYDRPINVNGVPVVVGYNLGCALAQLTRVGNNRNLWVDAICINQHDNEEKSSQIPLMPHIYTRAQNCLVWLMEEEGDLVDETVWSKVFTSQPKELDYWDSDSARQKQRIMEISAIIMPKLASNAYWQRVWIIQEIGSARSIKVLYRNFETDWPSFIYHLRALNDLSHCIPLKLQAQIDDKYSDGHSLQHLIESHQDSQCHEPRDHIYGFVGLANDAHNFPIDYSKSIYEVWKDTLLFTTESSKNSLGGIAHYARTLKRILGDPVSSVENRVDVAQDAERRLGMVQHAQVRHAQNGDPVISLSSLLEIPGHVLIETKIVGRLVHIGPAWTDCIAFPRKTADWKLSINKHFRDGSRPIARESSEKFLHKLESLTRADVDVVVNHRRSVIYDGSYQIAKKPENSTKLSWDAADAEIREKGFTFTTDAGVKDKNFTFTTDVDGNAPRLFLMDFFQMPHSDSSTKKRRRRSEQKVSIQASCVGLAPSDALPGDYVCQIDGLTEALVVRNSSQLFRVIGSCMLAQQWTKPKRESSPQINPWVTESDLESGIILDEPESKGLNVCLDISRFYEMLH